MLDVDRRDDVDPGLQKLLNVLPTLLITGPGGVGVGKFVDEGDVRVPGQHLVKIHLRQLNAAAFDIVPRDDLHPLSHRRSSCPAVSLNNGDNDIRPPGAQVLALVKHGVGLADARCRAQQHPQPSPNSHRVLLGHDYPTVSTVSAGDPVRH